MEAALDNQPRAVTKSILYEQPLNERVRTFLRLEYLFKQAAHHVKRGTEWDSRATLNCILEMLSIFGNTNLKSEVLKELERHAASLKRLEQNPGIDYRQLTEVLDTISGRMEVLHQINGQIASELKNSEFLASIRQRSAIPGGTCDFDLPAFHYWLQQPAKKRTDDLYRWLGNFDAIGQAIQMIIRLIRESSNLTPAIAERGVYQENLDPNLPYQLVRIALPASAPYYAELSGGRHRFTVRFLDFSTIEERAKQTSQDVEFELACCVI
ncbi:MAG: cell division protein ZapD [Gammaproteobacteria bacterium]|nr:MAG: cell division protein ZapD [Gammaproteobacteria bacterium]